MQRRIFIVVCCLIIASAIALIYVQVHSRKPTVSSVASVATPNTVESSIEQASASATVGESLSVHDPAEMTPPSEQTIARWIAETGSGNAHTRATAILALATAPKVDAVPALRRVLEGGEPTSDRPLALQSLRDIALHQGDDDGTIRAVVRETIYHSDDDSLVEGAQLALEIIEESQNGMNDG